MSDVKIVNVNLKFLIIKMNKKSLVDKIVDSLTVGVYYTCPKCGSDKFGVQVNPDCTYILYCTSKCGHKENVSYEEVLNYMKFNSK
jgi:hypothetical protein